MWKVAAAAAAALLGPGYAALRSNGLTPASAAARVEEELRHGGQGKHGSSSSSSSDGPISPGLLDTLIASAGSSGSTLEEEGVLFLVRDIFAGVAVDGKDLHHIDLLLRIMLVAAAESKSKSGDDNHGGGIKSATERRLKAHSGLVRRLLKASPPGLDYKCLVGDDPLADPLADLQDTEIHPHKWSTAVVCTPSNRSSDGLAAARARAMSELRSVAGLEHVPALSKLAARIPGLSGSSVYSAAAQRVLCGEVGGLSPEALGLLRFSDDTRLQGSEEEMEAASSSVYHLLCPLLQKLAPEDLVEIAAAACVPTFAGSDGLGYYPCRRPAGSTNAPVAVPASSSSPLKNVHFPDRMEPLRLTVRCRRRVLDAAMAVFADSSRTGASGGTAGGGGDSAAAAAAANASATDRLARLNRLLEALSAVSTVQEVGMTGPALEAAWAMAITADGSGDASAAAVAAQQRAISAASCAVECMALTGAPPATVEDVCVSMQAALGGNKQKGEMLAQTVGEDETGASAITAASASLDLLDPSRAYSRATSDALDRLIAADGEDRSRALEQLRVVCVATGPGGGRGGERQGQSAIYGGGDSQSTAAAARAWGVIAPALELFCVGGGIGSASCEESGGATVATPSMVLWARGEVFTLLRGYGGEEIVGAGDCRVEAATGEGMSNSGGEGIVNDVDDGAAAAAASAAVATRYSGTGDECGASKDGRIEGAGNDAGRASPSSSHQLSVPFFRVAELVMEAFGRHVSPDDVETSESRSTLLTALLTAATVAAVCPEDVKNGLSGDVDGETRLTCDHLFNAKSV